MNVILLPILTALVLTFAYLTLGRLVVATPTRGDEYTNTPTPGADSPISQGLRDFGILGTPFLLAGAAFGLRFGWAPVLLWILFAATTSGGATLFAVSGLATPPALRSLNTLARIAVSALLALLWAGLAAASPHALLLVVLVYLVSDRVQPLLCAGRGEALGLLVLTAGLAGLAAMVGESWPLALHGHLRLAIGPLARGVSAGPVLFYGLVFLLLIQKKRRGRLRQRPAYGAIGAFLLALTVAALTLGAIITHPAIPIARLRHGGLAPALPFLASALPFGAALSPLGDNPLKPRTPRHLYLLALAQGALAVGALVALLAHFPDASAWRTFEHARPGAVALLSAVSLGARTLLHGLGLGPWSGQVLRASLLLLTLAALESQQERLAATPPLAIPSLQALSATALVGAGLWCLHGLTPSDQILMGALFGVGAAGALLGARGTLPSFMVVLGILLLALTDMALITVGWHPDSHPLRAAGAGSVLAIEAIAAAAVLRIRRKSENHAARRPGNQP